MFEDVAELHADSPVVVAVRRVKRCEDLLLGRKPGFDRRLRPFKREVLGQNRARALL